MPWVCGIFKTREWVGGSKLLSNSVLLLVKLEVRLTAFRSARIASEILMIKRKTKTETWLGGKNQLNFPTFFRRMAGGNNSNILPEVTAIAILQTEMRKVPDICYQPSLLSRT